MYIVVNNGYVIAGPFRWARKRFEEILLDDLEIVAELPSVMPDDPYMVNENTTIYRVVNGNSEAIEPRIQFHEGPYWNFTDTHAEMYYKAQFHTLEFAKSKLKGELAAERWNKENKGTTIQLNGVDYYFRTDKETRNVFQSALNSGLETLNWKVDENTWLALTQADIQTIISGIATYVQSCFDWEKTISDQIDACGFKELLDIVIVEPEEVVEPPVE